MAGPVGLTNSSPSTKIYEVPAIFKYFSKRTGTANFRSILFLSSSRGMCLGAYLENDMAKAKSNNPATPKGELIKIAALKRTVAKVTIFGDTPLIVHAWSQKARMEMLAKQMGKTLPRSIKDPYDDFLQSIYRYDDGNYGFPVVAVKAAMATVTADLPDVKRAQIHRNVVMTGRRGFQLGAFLDIKAPMELAELFSPNPPSVREDMVKLSGIQKVPDLRYRAEFSPWALEFTMAYDPQMFASESLMNLLGRAGFTVGLGEWRQERGGSNGLFHPATLQEAAQVAKWKKAGPKQPAVIDSQAWLAEAIAKLPTRDEESAPKPKRARKGNGATTDATATH